MKKTIIKRCAAILMAMGYVLIFYAAVAIVQISYAVWQNSSGIRALSEIEINMRNGTYAISIISMIISLWIYILVGKIRKRPLAKVIQNDYQPPIVAIMAISLAIGLRFIVTVYYWASRNVELLKHSIDRASSITPQLTSAGQILVALLSMVVVAPFFEEILFRGIVMRELMRVVKTPFAVLLQALMFGMAHAVLFQSIFTFVIGVILGIVYIRTRSIKIAMLCHSAFNVSVILAQAEMSPPVGIVMVVAGVLISSCSLGYIIINTNKKV